MGIPILLLRLEGPLQSWGEQSKWDWRDTADFPSKSGVIGLLSCALGLERESLEISHLNRELTIMVRADRPGEVVTDFHTVTGYPLISANGKEKRTESGKPSNTIISHRSYLQDASFLVGITGEIALLRRLRDALDDPVWPIYLGRKSCVPAVPVIGKLTEDYETLLQAMENEPLSARHEGNRIRVEFDSAEGDGRLRPDLTIGPRSFQNRRVADRTIQVKEEENDSDESES